MQPKLGESPGQLGGGYQIFVVDDTIAVQAPAVQTPSGPVSEQIQIPRDGVIFCARDANYAFIVYARRETSPTAYAYRFDLNAGTHSKYDLPNDRGQILTHIHGYSPGVRHVDPIMLTGDATTVRAFEFGIITIGIGIAALAAIVIAYRLRCRRKRSPHPHPAANSF